jgi:AraC family transcriptional regulator
MGVSNRDGLLEETDSARLLWVAVAPHAQLNITEFGSGLWTEPASDCPMLHIRMDRLGSVYQQANNSDVIGRFEMASASTLLVPPHASISWRVSASFKRLTVQLRPGFLEEIAQNELLSFPANWELKPPRHDPVTEHYASLVLYESQNGQVPSAVFVESYARLLALQVVRRYLAPPPEQSSTEGLSPERKKKIDDYILRVLPSPILMEDLADVCGLSYHLLQRQLKQTTGDRPQQYVIKQRIALAKKLLRESDLPLVDIADATGFSSQSHFTNSFRQLCGYTPGHYRERQDLI